MSFDGLRMNGGGGRSEIATSLTLLAITGGRVDSRESGNDRLGPGYYLQL